MGEVAVILAGTTIPEEKGINDPLLPDGEGLGSRCRSRNL